MSKVAEITIPKYIYRVKISDAQQTIYHRKGGKRKIPKTYREKYSFDKNGYLIDDDGNRIVANPHTAGKPKYDALSGNKFSSGYGSPHQRNNLVHAMKDFYRPFVQDQLDPIDPRHFPLRVEWDVYTTVDPSNWDLSNFWFYYKYFEDCLSEDEDPNGNKIKRIIPDDSVKYITQSPGPRLFPISDFEERKFVFRFYTDDRKEIDEFEGLWENDRED